MANPTLPSYAGNCASVLLESYSGYVPEIIQNGLQELKSNLTLGNITQAQTDNIYLFYFVSKTLDSAQTVPTNFTAVYTLTGTCKITPIDSTLPATLQFKYTENDTETITISPLQNPVELNITMFEPGSATATNCVVQFFNLVVVYVGV